MAFIKSTVLVAALLLLNCHWIQSQYNGCGYGGYPGYPPIITVDKSDGLGNDILPLLLFTLLGRGGGFGGGCGYGGGCGCGCGSGCGGGCGCGNGCC